MRRRTQRRGAARRWVGIALVALALVVAACSGPGQPASVSGQGLSLHVLRTSAFPQNHIPPFERTVTDSAKAQAVYAALQALPPFPKGVMFCPVDIGEAYHLTFSRGQTTVSSVVVKPDGCESVTLANGDVRWAVGQQHFWTIFASALGVPQSTLFPALQPTGPSAPSADPNQP